MTAAEPLDDADRAELARLRREVDELRRTSRPPLSARRGLRWTAAAILLVLTAVLAAGAVAARYVHAELLDTDRYVTTVTPLADDPVLRAELTDRVTRRITDRLDIEKVTADALTELARDRPRVPGAVVALAPVIAGQADSFVHDRVAAFIDSDRFRTLWIEANRQAHRALVAALTGETRDALRIGMDGTVALNLGPILDAVRTDLTDRGFSVAANIPDTDATFVLFQSPRLARAQHFTSALDKASAVLPWLAVLAAALAVFAAPRGARRRAFVLAGVVVAVAMLLLAVAIAIGRAVYLREIPAEALSRESATIVFDTFAHPLRTSVRAVFVLAVVLAAAGYLTGPARSATALRRGYSRVADRVRGGTPGRTPHAIESVVATYRLPLRIAVIAIAAAVLVFWTYPTGLVVVVTVVVTLAVLLLLELVARPALGSRAD